MQLVIGNKNYSSWSLRPWLAMKFVGVAFDEIRIPLYGAGSKERISVVKVENTIDVYHDRRTEQTHVEDRHEALPAGEHLRLVPVLGQQSHGLLDRLGPLVPERDRLHRVVADHCHMHNLLPDDAAARTSEVDQDIARIGAIWAQAKGPFLFGEFTAADAMYAPVVLRFRTYDVDGPNRRYLEAMLALPPMREWIEAAEREAEAIPELDLYG